VAADEPKKPTMPPEPRKRYPKRIWALRILNLVRHEKISPENPIALRAVKIIGFKEAQKVVGDSVISENSRPHADAMNRRLPGSFRTGRS